MKRLALVLVLLVGCHQSAPPPPVAHDASPPLPAVVVDAGPPPRAERVLPDVKTDWCLEGWRGLDDATCYLLPENDSGADDPDELLIYLAGILPPQPRSTSKERVQRVVSNVAQRNKVVALLPRGRLGIGPKDAKEWWAWPTSRTDYVKYATTILAEWRSERKALETALGHEFKHVYLAGSSSGAYFLTLLAFAGATDFDGYAASSGGSPAVGVSPTAQKRPFYVGWGEGDPTNGGPKALATFVKAQGWPTKSVAHQTGHGAREVYLDEALAFFREVLKMPIRDR